ncbi:hypothetical protein ASD46_14030 [Rhizobium sp. Root491]|nr:hypothetical protein ASD46_14030 [Rhizobium sp. Root491]OMP73884.1 hypothetical protein BV900_00595 [Agrobacterium tumefaciens]
MLPHAIRHPRAARAQIISEFRPRGTPAPAQKPLILKFVGPMATIITGGTKLWKVMAKHAGPSCLPMRKTVQPAGFTVLMVERLQRV